MNLQAAGVIPSPCNGEGLGGEIYCSSPRPSPICGVGDMKAQTFLQDLIFANDEEFELPTSNKFPGCGDGPLPIAWGGLGWGKKVKICTFIQTTLSCLLLSAQPGNCGSK